MYVNTPLLPTTTPLPSFSPAAFQSRTVAVSAATCTSFGNVPVSAIGICPTRSAGVSRSHAMARISSHPCELPNLRNRHDPQFRKNRSTRAGLAVDLSDMRISPNAWHTMALQSARRKMLLPALLVVCLLSGCAAITNPVVNGIPVHLLPPEL